MRARASRPVLVVVAAFALVGASCRHEVDPRRVTMTDNGALCLGAVPESDGGEGGVSSGVDLREGESLAVSVRSGCLSNVCATARTAKCAVKRDGDRLVVTSELSWIGPEDLGRPCPADCTFLESQCKTEPLPAGSYKVVLGATTQEITLPSHLAVRCDRDKPLSPIVLPAPRPAASVVATPAGSVDPQSVPSAPGTGVAATEPPPGDTLCIGPAIPNKTRSLKKGQPVAITVLHKNECVAAACTKAPGKCTVKRKGFDLTLSAQFPLAGTKPTQPCSEDCTAIAATCRTDALPAGTYTLAVGEHKKTLTIPAATAPACGP